MPYHVLTLKAMRAGFIKHHHIHLGHEDDVQGFHKYVGEVRIPKGDGKLVSIEREYLYHEYGSDYVTEEEYQDAMSSDVIYANSYKELREIDTYENIHNGLDENIALLRSPRVIVFKAHKYQKFRYGNNSSYCTDFEHYDARTREDTRDHRSNVCDADTDLYEQYLSKRHKHHIENQYKYWDDCDRSEDLYDSSNTIHMALHQAALEYNSGVLDEDWDEPHVYNRRKSWIW
jgi:hypothetical protein